MVALALKWKKQPLRAFYLLHQAFVLLFVWIPLWLLASLPRSSRPRRSWNLRRCINVKVYKRLVVLSRRLGRLRSYPDHRALAEGVGINGIWIDPIPSDLLLDPVASWASTSRVHPIRIPGYWYNEAGAALSIGAPPALGERVVYALHGGAYVARSAYPGDASANVARGLLEACGSVRRVFSPEYRLSVNAVGEAASPFPAALIDTLAGYHYLVNVIGFAPENIIVEGNSAGGNLALALTRYLVEHAGTLGSLAPPGALLLLSPWSDIGISHYLKPDCSARRHQHSDYLTIFDNRSAARGRDAFLGPHGPIAGSCVYLSPASLKLRDGDVSFKAFPRTFVCAGGAEALLDQVHTLVERMGKDMGAGIGQGEVVYHEAPDGIHDFLVFKWHEPERSEALAKIAEWVGSL